MTGCKGSTHRVAMSLALHREFSNLLNLFALDETYLPSRRALGEMANDCNRKSVGAQIAGQPGGRRDTQDDRNILRRRPVGVAHAGFVWLRLKPGRLKRWLFLSGTANGS